MSGRGSSMGGLARGPGHYALGRGHLALQEPEQAREHLEQAQASGYTSPELEYALGRAMGELYVKALREAKRIENKAEREARIRELEVRYRDSALAHLRGGAAGMSEEPAYARGLIAFYSANYEEALAEAKEAFAKVPWLYEAKKLEGDAQFALGSRYRPDAAFDRTRMSVHFNAAAEAYGTAAEIARSDPEVHLAACELWTQIMNSSTQAGEPVVESFNRAKEACARAVAASSRNGQARVQRAFTYASFAFNQTVLPTVGADPREPIEEGMRLAEEAVRASPGDAMAHYVAGLIARADLRFTIVRRRDATAAIRRAVDSYEAALRIDPHHLWALHELASTYNYQLQFESMRGIDPAPVAERAIQIADRVTTIDPAFVPMQLVRSFTHILMAHQLIERGRSPKLHVDQAADAAEFARQRSPDSMVAYEYLALAHMAMARYEAQAGLDPWPSLRRAAQFVEVERQRAGAMPFVQENLGHLQSIEALSLMREGKDPHPALGQARAAYQRAMEAVPWAVDLCVASARAAILNLRWALGQRKASAGMFEEALGLLLPLLSEERVDPNLYQAMAEILALRARWSLDSGKSPDDDLAQGQRMAEKALSLNPHMATALAVRGDLHLVEASAAGDPSAARAEATWRAQQAFEAAFRENPLLERDHRGALQAPAGR